MIALTPAHWASCLGTLMILVTQQGVAQEELDADEMARKLSNPTEPVFSLTNFIKIEAGWQF